MSAKFKLGARVRDKLSGIEGTIIAYVFHLSGCQHVEIEPDPVDGKRSDIVYLPEERFDLIDEGYSDAREADISDCHVKLGNEAKDTLTGFKGYVTMILVPLHGVARIAIEPTTIKDGKMADAIFFDEQRVEVIKPKEPPVAPDMPEARKQRGCAPSRVSAKMAGRVR